MRVLVLRPEPQASRMAADLAARGIGATVAPMLEIVSETGVVGRVLDGGAPPPDALVFTSANGVAALAADPERARLSIIPAYAVGPATADAARAVGIRAVEEAGPDAGALLRRIIAGLRPGSTVVHIAGRDRAVDLAGRLNAAGFAARTVVAYRAEATDRLDPTVASGLALGLFDVAVVASRRTAESFNAAIRREVLPLPLGRPVVLAISAGAAEPLAALFTRIEVVPTPDGAALVDRLVALAAAVANNDTERPP